MRIGKGIVFCLLGIALTAGCATTGAGQGGDTHPRDPWEEYNRAVFEFNRTIDAILWRPLAVGYKNVVPHPVRTGVSNFFVNLSYPIDIVNLLLQGKPRDSFKALGRFVINSTIGVLGIFDVASEMGIPTYEEDFGQTLAVWGWKGSPYLVLPILGGAALTQTIGYVPDYYFNVGWRHINEDDARYPLLLLNITRIRAQWLAQEGAMGKVFDKYTLFRNTYFQRREYLIKDGETDLPDYQSLLESGLRIPIEE